MSAIRAPRSSRAPRAVRVLGGILLLLLVGGAAVASLVADEDASAFQGDEVDLAADAKVQRLATGPLALRNEPAFADAVVVIQHADDAYTNAELDALDDHVRAGGTVVVLDAQGHGTQVTDRHGIAFERVRLDQEGGAVTVEVDDASLRVSTEGATALLVDADAVEDGAVEVVAWSGPDSHLDRGGDGVIDEADPAGPFPVIARVPLGDGHLWAIAAPAAFDPDAEQLLDEAALREVVFGDAELVLLDEGKLATDDPLLAAARIAWLLSADPWRWAFPVAAGLVLVAAALPALVPGLRAHAFDPRTFLPRHGAREEVDAEPARPDGFTARGRVAVAASAALLAVGLAFANTQAAWAGAVLLVPSLGALFVGPPAATAVRTVSAKRVAEGSTVRVDLRLQFKGNRAGVVVQDELPGFFEAEPSPLLQPRRRVEELHYTVKPARLGRYAIGPLRAERSDPLGLRVQVSTLLEENDLRVTPRLEGTRDAPFRTRVPQIISGQHPVNRAGGGTEFLALREYQHGDTMRMVNWKASARAKNLMVNQRIHETPMALTLIVDARAVSDWGPADSTPFVRAARSAASIAQETIAGRDKCRIYLYGDGVTSIEGRGADILHRFQEHMADAQATGGTPLGQVVEELVSELKSGQPVVYVGAGEDDPTLLDALETVRRRDVPVHIVLPVIEDLGDAQTRKAHSEQETLAGKLRGRGFKVYALEPEHRLEDSWRFVEGA